MNELGGSFLVQNLLLVSLKVLPCNHNAEVQPGGNSKSFQMNSQPLLNSNGTNEHVKSATLLFGLPKTALTFTLRVGRKTTPLRHMVGCQTRQALALLIFAILILILAIARASHVRYLAFVQHSV